MDQAFQYIVANKGIDTEASYPYQGVDGTCHYTAANSGATITAYSDVTSGSETALAAAASKQPVSVAIDASHTSFQLYKQGVYHDVFCSATKLDHGVLVVGFGTDTTSKKAYWIVKNSWGASWGQSGYIYMSKDRNNNCGIATSASVPTSTSTMVGDTTKKTTHVSAASHHTGDSHTGDTHTGDSHTGDSHTGDSHTGDTHTGDTHTGDTHTGDSHTNAATSSTSAATYGGSIPAKLEGGRGSINQAAAKFNF